MRAIDRRCQVSKRDEVDGLTPKPDFEAWERAMMTKPKLVRTQPAGEALDELFHECAELETLVASIRQTMSDLNPAVDTGLVTPEHLMNLAFRVENAEHGLIAIARQINDMANTVIKRCKDGGAVH
jgi:hypothetical protein